MFFTYKRIFITYGILAFLPTIAIFGVMDKEPFVVTAIGAFIINVIGVSSFALIGFFLRIIEGYFRRKSHTEFLEVPQENTFVIPDPRNHATTTPKILKRPGEKTKNIIQPIVKTEHAFCIDFYEIPEALDYIQFRYVTLKGEEDTYTLAVTGQSNGKIIGHCYERNDERSFFPDSIINGEVIRISTSEILPTYAWLKEISLSPISKTHRKPLDKFGDVDNFSNYLSDKELPPNFTILRTDSGSIGIFKLFKNGKRYKNPTLFLEVRSSYRSFLVNGDCPGKSFRNFDSAANYFNEQFSLLLDEIKNGAV
jgi:hypothetical protein